MPISVVIPSFNGRHLLEKHVLKVINAIRKDDEIIVVDDASTDNTHSWLKENYPAIRVIAHQKNQRFAASVNSGVNAAQNEIIILLNNDVSPDKSFLGPLLTHFNDERVFAVGCKEIQAEKKDPGVFPSSLTPGSNLVESGRSCGAFRRGFLVHWRCHDQNQPTTLWATGGSMALRKSVFQKLGGMDTLFAPAYWEDIDLSYRAKKQGYKVLFEPKAIVYHQHETTNVKELGRLIMQSSAYKNQCLFVWKNVTDWHLLAKHLLWLPYHLLITTIRSRGLFLIGFAWALLKLPRALKARWSE